MQAKLDLVSLPTQDDLPCDDGVPMETQRHKLQLDLLMDGLLLWLEQRDNGYVGGNMFLYFSMAQLRNQDFLGPDFFAVIDVPKGERKSWVVWEQGKAPDVIIELLSESTANQDKTHKKLIYQNQLRIPEYYWFDPFNPDDWAGFSLQNGIYQSLELNQFNQLVSQRLGLALQRWSGIYKGVETIWLRWANLEGEILLTPEEYQKQRADQEQQRADQEQQRAQQSQLYLQQTVINLLQEGMSIEQVARLTGLSLEQINTLS
ncbi:protein of unknown function DUF820 [Gloeothece citriformis PCC 7424]|uniref:Putative restriction endonuclease domain-containing protein n=1 Tax=Gloeothece citriformis (strain PCC 7424) TaxID=65393 RepID=B7KE70_GLOC7|nr:Uma2 family endonuclease [Gloeothece citriformis]ACK71768.1 protein of unknown function DUF820 [Gloeothece citriformis PCC 7424]